MELERSHKCSICGEAIWGDPSHVCPPLWNIDIAGNQYDARAFSDEAAINQLVYQNDAVAEYVADRLGQDLVVKVKEDGKTVWREVVITFSLTLKGRVKNV